MGGRVPTWRMVPGSSSESLALDVALQCQVPPEIVYRAAQLFKVQPLKSSASPRPPLFPFCCPYTAMFCVSNCVGLLGRPVCYLSYVLSSCQGIKFHRRTFCIGSTYCGNYNTANRK